MNCLAVAAGVCIVVVNIPWRAAWPGKPGHAECGVFLGFFPRDVLPNLISRPWSVAGTNRE